jgi:hypothetical protein
MAALADTLPGGIVLYDDESGAKPASISAYSSGTKPKKPYEMVADDMPGWFSMKCGTATYGPFDGTKITLLDVAFDVKHESDPVYERVEGKNAGTRMYRKKGTSARGTTINSDMYRPRSLYAPERPGTPKRPAPSSSASGAAKKTRLEAMCQKDADDLATLPRVEASDMASASADASVDGALGPPPTATSAETGDAIADVDFEELMRNQADWDDLGDLGDLAELDELLSEA